MRRRMNIIMDYNMGKKEDKEKVCGRRKKVKKTRVKKALQC